MYKNVSIDVNMMYIHIATYTDDIAMQPDATLCQILCPGP